MLTYSMFVKEVLREALLDSGFCARLVEVEVGRQLVERKD